MPDNLSSINRTAKSSDKALVLGCPFMSARLSERVRRTPAVAERLGDAAGRGFLAMGFRLRHQPQPFEPGGRAQREILNIVNLVAVDHPFIAFSLINVVCPRMRGFQSYLLIKQYETEGAQSREMLHALHDDLKHAFTAAAPSFLMEPVFGNSKLRMLTDLSKVLKSSYSISRRVHDDSPGEANAQSFSTIKPTDNNLAASATFLINANVAAAIVTEITPTSLTPEESTCLEENIEVLLELAGRSTPSVQKALTLDRWKQTVPLLRQAFVADIALYTAKPLSSLGLNVILGDHVCDLTTVEVGPRESAASPNRMARLFTPWQISAFFRPSFVCESRESRELPLPEDMSEGEGALLGNATFYSSEKRVRLTPEARSRHLYVVGQTGAGKSTLLENLALQDIAAGAGVCVIDPHGPLVDAVARGITGPRAKDVILFDPVKDAESASLNLFEASDELEKDILIQEFIDILYKMYDPLHTGIMGPRFEHWFRCAALAVMADPAGATLADVPKMFTDKQFAASKVAFVTDSFVRDFWEKEMGQTSDYHKSEVLGWFLSKFSAILGNRLMRSVLSSKSSTIRPEEIMRRGQILLVKLNKGEIGPVNSQFLGLILMAKFQQAIMGRTKRDGANKRPFYLYADEFHNISSDSFPQLLAEARKFGVGLVLANQHSGQLSNDLREAIAGNVGTKVAFRLGVNDAPIIVSMMGDELEPADFKRLDNFKAYVSTSKNGRPLPPFRIKTIKNEPL